MTTPSKYFPAPPSDKHYVEIVETATGKVEKRMGPMSEHKADKVEMGVLHRINLERFFVRTGTDAALKKEAAHDEPTIESLQRAGIVSSDPNAKRSKPAGSSPALRIACPVCHAAAGAYCTRFEKLPAGGVAGVRQVQQTIAHKRRREEEERTR